MLSQQILGFLRPITRRLDEHERSRLIQSGAVFVWEESDHAPGLKRWTGKLYRTGLPVDVNVASDGRVWSQSRMREVCPSFFPKDQYLVIINSGSLICSMMKGWATVQNRRI